MDTSEIYERLIHEDLGKNTRIMLTTNDFRGIEYISIRKYYQEFSGDWCPSNEGITIPIGLDNTIELFKGLAEIISLAERREVIEEYFGDIIRELYK